MPTYDYRCEKCHKTFSVTLTFKEHESKRITCPRCKSRVVKQQIRPVYVVTSRKA